MLLQLTGEQRKLQTILRPVADRTPKERPGKRYNISSKGAANQ